MTLDHRAAKLSEMRAAAKGARSTVDAISDHAIETALGAFARVTPPTDPDPPQVRHGYVTIKSLYTAPEATSRKPGNVLLNWRKLIDIVPDVSLAGLGAATLPIAPAWSAVLAGLYIWNKIWRASVEDLSDWEAVAMLAMWKNRDGDDKIGEPDALAKTNVLRASYSLPLLTQVQFSSVVDRLVEIDCIELAGGVIWLRESVKINYP